MSRWNSTNAVQLYLALFLELIPLPPLIQEQIVPVVRQLPNRLPYGQLSNPHFCSSPSGLWSPSAHTSSSVSASASSPSTTSPTHTRSSRRRLSRPRLSSDSSASLSTKLAKSTHTHDDLNGYRRVRGDW